MSIRVPEQPEMANHWCDLCGGWRGHHPSVHPAGCLSNYCHTTSAADKQAGRCVLCARPLAGLLAVLEAYGVRHQDCIEAALYEQDT